MKKNDYTELIIQSGSVSAALKGLQTMFFRLPNAAEIRPSDINQIVGMVDAIMALAEKNEKEIAEYFEY